MVSRVRSWGGFPPVLAFHRLPRPPAPVTQVTRTTQVTRLTAVRQTVTQVMQVIHRHLHQHIDAAGRWDTFLFVLPQARLLHLPDASRPARTARTLVRILSGEGARRELLPFYSGVVRGVLREEQERYKSRPSQAVSLIWTLFGRPHAFRTLTRFYLSAARQMGSSYFPALTSSNALFLAAGIVLHSRLYRQYVHRLWAREAAALPLRYAVHERAVTAELIRYPDSRPSREMLLRLLDTAGEARPAAAPPPAREVRLSEEDFRTLVRDVADSLTRRSRLRQLQKGGM